MSSQYLDVCRQHKYNVEDSPLGTALVISPKYYKKSVEIAYEMGMKLAQVVWRKLLPTQVDEANKALNSLAYNLIYKRQYSTASSMLKFGLHDIKAKLKDSAKKQMIVNYANAEKLGII